MRIHLDLTLPTAVQPTENVLQIAGMFGLGIDQEKTIRVIPPIDIDISGGQIIFITGPSGSGKSTLLRLIDQALENQPGVNVLRFHELRPHHDRPLVDCFDGMPLDEVVGLLSVAGINDAFVMLRSPAQLSDGQRYRFLIAQAIAVASRSGQHGMTVVLADEFGAALDRLTASVIARNIRKWVDKNTHVCFVLATTHDDLLEPLDPDVLIFKHLGSDIKIVTRPEKKGIPA